MTISKNSDFTSYKDVEKKEIQEYFESILKNFIPIKKKILLLVPIQDYQLCQGDFYGSNEIYLLLCIRNDYYFYMHIDCMIKNNGYVILEKINGKPVNNYDLFFNILD